MFRAVLVLEQPDGEECVARWLTVHTTNGARVAAPDPIKALYKMGEELRRQELRRSELPE